MRYSHIVKNEIESLTNSFLKENPFVRNVRTGDLTKDQISRYLQNLLYSISHTPPHLALARDSAANKGFKKLSEFMEEKRLEEIGHDEWAKSDIRAIKGGGAGSLPGSLTKNVQDLVHLAESLSKNNPDTYLAYLTYLEYFTVLTAPEFMDCLESKYGIPRTSMSVVAQHGELDKEHAQDNWNAIDQFIDSDDKFRSFLKTTRQVAQLIDGIFVECMKAA